MTSQATTDNGSSRGTEKSGHSVLLGIAKARNAKHRFPSLRFKKGKVRVRGGREGRGEENLKKARKQTGEVLILVLYWEGLRDD